MARGPAGRQADLRFLVMTNIFDTPLKIHEQYDLKGSTVGRHVDAPDNNEEGEAEVALKDLDFKRRIFLGPENKAILLEQLEQDCKVRPTLPRFPSTYLRFYSLWSNTIYATTAFWLEFISSTTNLLSTTPPSSPPRRNHYRRKVNHFCFYAKLKLLQCGLQFSKKIMEALCLMITRKCTLWA